MSDLEYSVADGVGTIMLNRPEKKNAFTLEMVDQWADILVNARTAGDVNVVLVTGAGNSFCSGVDLAGLDGDRTPWERKSVLDQRVHRVALALQDLDKPVIAAVNGPAVGAGMDMALMCDIRVASRSARFSEGYVKVGLVPGDGGCYFLPRIVGMARALELMWTGDFIDADKAEQWGVVSHVWDDDTFTDQARAFALRLAAGPPLAIRLIKRAAQQSATSDLRTALDLISSHMAVVRSTQDSAEALAAFRERRPGRFVGR